MLTAKFAAAVIVLGVLCSGGASAQRGNRFLIDIDRETIGSVSRDDSFQQLRNRFGSANVTRSTEELEGEASPIVKSRPAMLR